MSVSTVYEKKNTEIRIKNEIIKKKKKKYRHTNQKRNYFVISERSETKNLYAPLRLRGISRDFEITFDR